MFFHVSFFHVFWTSALSEHLPSSYSFPSLTPLRHAVRRLFFSPVLCFLPGFFLGAKIKGRSIPRIFAWEICSSAVTAELQRSSEQTRDSFSRPSHKRFRAYTPCEVHSLNSSNLPQYFCRVDLFSLLRSLQNEKSALHTCLSRNVGVLHCLKSVNRPIVIRL